jgi:hypothetical protein
MEKHMRLIYIAAPAAIACAILASLPASAQVPPEGTTREACKANPEWRWVGIGKSAKCRRKVGKFLSDKQKEMEEKKKK